jgi:hypothetical protein
MDSCTYLQKSRIQKKKKILIIFKTACFEAFGKIFTSFGKIRNKKQNRQMLKMGAMKTIKNCFLPLRRSRTRKHES